MMHNIIQNVKKLKASMLKKPDIRKLFKIFKFPSHFHVTLTAGIITLQFNIRIDSWNR